MKHWSVTSMDYALLGEEPEIIWDSIEAETKAKAKGAFVSRNRQAIKREVGEDNPFVGIKVEDFMCKHGVCNCDPECQRGKPAHPKFDVCGECVREEAGERMRSAFSAWLAGSGIAEYEWRCAVEELLDLVPDSSSGGA